MAEKKATNQPEKPDTSKPETPAKGPSDIPSPPGSVTSAPTTPPNTSQNPPTTTETPQTPDGPQTPPDEGAQEPPEEEKSELEKLREKNEADAAEKTNLNAESRAAAAREAQKPPPETGRFDATKLIHKNDLEFLAVADVTVPKTSATWQHPKNEKILFCYGLAQMVAGKELKLKTASRDVVLEWIYVRIWRPLSLGGLCKNTEAASAILKLLMIMPRRTATQIIQNTIINAGRKHIGSPGSAPVDGIFGPKTHGAIYSELCKHYEQTKAAIHGQVYAKFQEYAGSDSDSWAPVLQAYATDRL